MDINILTVFILAIFVGIEIITKVPPTLHTPLMSVTNAISGIIIVGSLTLLCLENNFNNSKESSFDLSLVLGYMATVLASVNIFGGFVVTQRMLSMYKKKKNK